MKGLRRVFEVWVFGNDRVVIVFCSSVVGVL